MSLAGEWKQGQEGHRQLSHDSPPIGPRVIESQRDARDARGRRRGEVNLAMAAGRRTGARYRGGRMGAGGLCLTVSRSHGGQQSRCESLSFPDLNRPNDEAYLLSDKDEGGGCGWGGGGGGNFS